VRRPTSKRLTPRKTKSDVSAQVELSKLAIADKKADLDVEVADYRITSAEKYASLRDLVTQSANLDLQSVQQEMATLQQGTVTYERSLNQLKAEIRQ
jgi:hypothetical protein